MANAVRIGDTGTGVCSKHTIPEPYTTVFTDGSKNVLINGLGAVTATDQNGDATCGDRTTAITGSSSVFINGKPAHRVGDTGANFGPYTAASGSANVIIG